MTHAAPTAPATGQQTLRVTQPRVLLSEWTKFRSLRSTMWTLLTAVVLTIGIGALFSAVTANQYHTFSAADKASFNPITTSLNGILFSQLAIGVLGVLLISGEYSTGMIRSSLTAVPRRLPVLWAKLGVFAAVAFAVMLVTSFVSFFVGQALLSSHHLGVSISAPNALRDVIGAALYVTVAGIIGMTLGALMRNTAAGISTMVALFFVLPPVAGLLPSSWSSHFVQYLPSNAGGVLYGGASGLAHPLAPWTGFGLLCAYAVVLIGLAAWRLRRADALSGEIIDAVNTFPLFGHPPVRSVRWWMFDVLVTVLAALFSLPDLAQEHVTLTLSAVLVQVALTLPLLVRRVWPSAVFGFIFGVSAVAGLLNVHLVVSFALVVALYTVAAYESRRRALAAAGLLEGGVIAAVIRLAGSAWWHLAFLGTGMVAAALGLGLYTATRRAYLKELHDRAERLERERDQQQELAAAAERARITREMHDILAHHLAVMIALSDGAAAASAGSSPQAAKAMRTVSATGRQALGDTRRLLSGPREDAGADGERQPLPDLSGLDALVARVRAAGLPVSYELHGAPAPLSTGVQLTVYRLVQEALTNTLKHAGAGTKAVVRLWYLPGELRLVIEDDGAGASTPRPDTGGRGLAGMRQRVQTFGGEVQAGPRSPAGWRVSALLRLDQEIPA